MNTTITLSPAARDILDAAALAPQRERTNRRSPGAEELLSAGYVAEKPGVGLVITAAGEAAWAELHRAAIEAAKARLRLPR